jgi:hypothetical protein
MSEKFRESIHGTLFKGKKEEEKSKKGDSKDADIKQ